MYRPRRSIYHTPPKEKWHRCALDWWVYCYEWIPVCANAQIGGRKVRRPVSFDL
jgi:hypothetical protein